ncbi:MAG: hypothetical protein KGH60_02275 [Candidatus Micrarchaeota archaeon]|nr:hypothetical protein [Candidatus Micrarchaeota archaeon]
MTFKKAPKDSEQLKYFFYKADGNSVLSGEQQNTANELLNRFVYGDDAAFEQYKGMFKKRNDANSQEGKIKDLIRSYEQLRGGKLGLHELEHFRKECEFVACYWLGDRDVIAVQGAFAYATKDSTARKKRL